MTAAYDTGTPDLVDFNWETCVSTGADGFYVYNEMFVVFNKGELVPYVPIELNPAAAVLNYGQGLLEGLRAHRKEDGSILVFRPNESALWMRIGADRLCMPAPSVEQFLSGVKQTILANKRWARTCPLEQRHVMHLSFLVCAPLQVPPTGKGSLYIRPLLIGNGAILGVAPAPQ